MAAAVYVLQEGYGEDKGACNRRAKLYAEALRTKVVSVKSKRRCPEGVDRVPAICAEGHVIIGSEALDALADQMDSTVDGAAAREEIDRRLPPRKTAPMVAQRARGAAGGRASTVVL